MRQNSYGKFSFRRHFAQTCAAALNSCHFEVTYRCALSCEHCQAACYNNAAAHKRELSTAQVFKILDAIRARGVLWLAFSGGDPLCRPDFPEIYEYAKRCGFLVTIFTSAASLTPALSKLLKKQPPFCVEVTLNAATPALYDKISGVKGSFAAIKRNLRLLRGYGVPLRIKSQLTASNQGQAPLLQKLAAELKAPLHFFGELNAGLEHDPSPCAFRLPPERYAALSVKGRVCGARIASVLRPKTPFFCGALSGQGMGVDAYGNLFLCELIRRPGLNLLHMGIGAAMARAKAYLRGIKFSARSRCRACAGFGRCGWCPGQAYLENRKPAEPLAYYCRAWEAVK